MAKTYFLYISAIFHLSQLIQNVTLIIYTTTNCWYVPEIWSWKICCKFL